MIKQKHQQLFDILALQLHSGRWKKGDRLPSVREFAQEYHVSINVVSKAIELLRNAGLVSVKTGDGVFSLTQPTGDKQDVRYSGNRIFGHYASAKHLRVLVEDSTNLQLLFWNRFFKSVTDNYRDIELEITYGQTDQKDFDIAFGGLIFLLNHGFSPEKSLSTKEQELFAPGIYQDILLTPENCRMGEHRNFFPYGYTLKELISTVPLPPPVEKESVLEYIERLAARSQDSPVSYSILSGLEYLSNAGIYFCDPDNGNFMMPDPELLKNVFERTATLFRAGHLLWQHGEIRDESLPAKITEIPQLKKGLADNNFYEYPLPPGKQFAPVTYLAAVSANTLFPEECFRVITGLLTKEFQAKAEEERIFNAIRPAAKNSDIIKHQEHIPGVICNSQNAGLGNILQYFVTWELFHYINGKCNFNAQRLEAKIRWFLEHSKNQIPQ